MSAPGMKITNFHYSHVPFKAPDVFVEFPKWVHMPGYQSVVANTAEDEAILRSRPPLETGNPLVPGPQEPEISTPVVEPVRTLTGPNDEREILWQIAEERALKIDKRWNLQRLRAFIERETAHL